MKFDLEILGNNALKIYILYCSLGGLITYIFPFLRFIFPLIFLMFFLKFLFNGNLDKKFLFILFIIIYLLYSLLFNGLQYVVYGLYVFYAILFSFIFRKDYYIRFFNDYKFWLTILITNCIGILYVNFERPAWIGMEQDLFGITKQVSREWGTLGMFRNPGFTNGSVTVASLIIISGLLYLESIFNKKNLMLVFLSIPIYCLITYCLYLSTTKTIMYSFIFLSILRFFPVLILKITSILLLLVSVLISLYYFLFGKILYSDTENSLLIRMEYTWPWSFSQLEGYKSIWGGGFGVVGSSSYLSGTGIPADNFFVYLYMIFGIFSLFFILFFWIKVCKNIFKLNVDKSFLLIFLALIFFAFTNNLVESIVFPVIVGIIIKVFYYPSKF
ncbi:hypothetical protein [Pseudomonas sp.]|uniref:hypothetical protein n=1 Tax=Pseudomonas sp. TaxID=306 RepID=UPI001992C80D|nr:hypothetical protein [Pseudomonas sp.]MBC6627143.1 hypothetical protein [Pseudomonas sp.]